jgi:hypothetical protein
MQQTKFMKTNCTVMFKDCDVSIGKVCLYQAVWPSSNALDLRCSVQINWDPGYSEIFRSFLQTLQASTPRFLATTASAQIPFQCIILPVNVI